MRNWIVKALGGYTVDDLYEFSRDRNDVLRSEYKKLQEIHLDYWSFVDELQGGSATWGGVEYHETTKRNPKTGRFEK